MKTESNIKHVNIESPEYRKNVDSGKPYSPFYDPSNYLFKALREGYSEMQEYTDLEKDYFDEYIDFLKEKMKRRMIDFFNSSDTPGVVDREAREKDLKKFLSNLISSNKKLREKIEEPKRRKRISKIKKIPSSSSVFDEDNKKTQLKRLEEKSFKETELAKVLFKKIKSGDINDEDMDLIVEANEEYKKEKKDELNKFVEQLKKEFISLLSKVLSEYLDEEKSEEIIQYSKKRLSQVDFSVVTYLNYNFYSDNLDTKGVYIFENDSILIPIESLESIARIEENEERIKNTLVHEILHSISGNSIRQDLENPERNKLGLTFNTRNLEPTQGRSINYEKGVNYFRWLNEAITQKLSDEISGIESKNIYENEKEVLESLKSGGLDMNLLMKAYFESIKSREKNDEKQHRLPETNNFFKHINKEFGKRLFFYLDLAIKEGLISEQIIEDKRQDSNFTLLIRNSSQEKINEVISELQELDADLTRDQARAKIRLIKLQQEVESCSFDIPTDVKNKIDSLVNKLEQLDEEGGLGSSDVHEAAVKIGKIIYPYQDAFRNTSENDFLDAYSETKNEVRNYGKNLEEKFEDFSEHGFDLRTFNNRFENLSKEEKSKVLEILFNNKKKIVNLNLDRSKKKIKKIEDKIKRLKDLKKKTNKYDSIFAKKIFDLEQNWYWFTEGEFVLEDDEIAFRLDDNTCTIDELNELIEKWEIFVNNENEEVNEPEDRKQN